MPKTFSYDVLLDERREDWVEVPCDENDPDASTVRVMLCELPDREYQRLLVLLSASYKASGTTSRSLLRQSKGHALAEVEAWESQGEALIDAGDKVSGFKKELLARMVIDHNPADFIIQVAENLEGKRKERMISSLRRLGLSEEEIAVGFDHGLVEVKFKAGEWLYKKEPQRGAAPEMVSLYTESDAFLESLYNACRRFQALEELTPQEVWAQAAKTKEEAKKRNQRHFSLDVPLERSAQLAQLLEEMGLTTEEVQRAGQEGSVLLRFPANPALEVAPPDPLARTNP